MDTQPRHGYPVNQPYQQGPVPGYDFVAPPVPPKRKRKIWPWVLGGLALVMLAGCGLVTLVLGAGAKAINDEVEGTKTDVSLVAGSCKGTEYGWEAKVKITNSGKSNRSYWVQVNLEKGATRLGEAHAIVNDLGPGKSVTETASGSGDLVKGATCSVGDVN